MSNLFSDFSHKSPSLTIFSFLDSGTLKVGKESISEKISISNRTFLRTSFWKEADTQESQSDSEDFCKESLGAWVGIEVVEP